jgi:hypothetical protein
MQLAATHKEESMSSRALHRFNKYHKWWEKTEKIIFRLAIVLFALLYTTQLLNFVLEQRGTGPLSAAIGRHEGVAVADSQSQLNLGTLELTVTSNSDYSKLEIYINGEFYSTFKQKSVSLNVKNNDIIEVSGIKSEYTATIKVTSLSENITSPKLNSSIRVDKGFYKVGRIRLK